MTHRVLCFALYYSCIVSLVAMNNQQAQIATLGFISCSSKAKRQFLNPMNAIEVKMQRHVLADFSLFEFQFMAMAHTQMVMVNIQGPHKINDHAV